MNNIEHSVGLKSRIFITAEFILRHESVSETCLKGSTFPNSFKFSGNVTLTKNNRQFLNFCCFKQKLQTWAIREKSERVRSQEIS